MILLKLSEAKISRLRQILAAGWLILIALSFYDPVSSWLTQPDNLISPFRVHADVCIPVQGECLIQDPYVLAPRIFWSGIVPISIVILLVAGHESWRRICPLSFFSQIPTYLGIGYKVKKVNPVSGSVRHDLLGIAKDSWLGKNYLYLQLVLFYIGLNIRLLFANGSGIGFGVFMLVTIATAMFVGYLFKGKSWCQYFCPMAPVQIFFTGTRGLFSSDAHLDAAKVTQSMCRTIDSKGGEKSGCVGCQATCIDVDVQLNYWKSANQPDRELLFYGYFGLMVGFFFYMYLYAGNWNYYTSGAWSHDPQQLSSLFDPGFYLAGTAIPIPKLVAAPLTLALCTCASLFAGRSIEKAYQTFTVESGQSLKIETIKHYCYSFWVFISFNIFFGFILRPNISFLPAAAKFIPSIILFAVSFLWLQHSLKRSSDSYDREDSTIRLIRRVQKSKAAWQDSLEVRSIDNFTEEDVRTLSKLLIPKTDQKSKK
jgi:hypothetical protein